MNHLCPILRRSGPDPAGLSRSLGIENKAVEGLLQFLGQKGLAPKLALVLLLAALAALSLNTARALLTLPPAAAFAALANSDPGFATALQNAEAKQVNRRLGRRPAGPGVAPYTNDAPAYVAPAGPAPFGTTSAPQYQPQVPAVATDSFGSLPSFVPPSDSIPGGGGGSGAIPNVPATPVTTPAVPEPNPIHLAGAGLALLAAARGWRSRQRQVR